MNLEKMFQYGFIVACLLNCAIAMDDEHSDESARGKKIFKCPTIDEIHTYAKTLKTSPSWNVHTSALFTLTTKEGVIFKARTDPWDQNMNIVQRTLNLTKYDSTLLVEKEGSLKKILFRYSPDIASGITIKVDLEKMGVAPMNVSYETNVSPERVSDSLDNAKYITFNDPNLVFTIAP